MRILVLNCCYLNPQIANCIRRLPVEYVEFPLPLKAIRSSLQQRIRHARKLLRAIEQQKPDLILDLHGLGVLPLDESAQNWVPTESGKTWCVWWWDTPWYFISRSAVPSTWINVMKSPDVIHFTWDEPLSREYSVWFEKPVRWLPTGVDPSGFASSPRGSVDVAKPKYDIAFLGTFFRPSRTQDHSPIGREIEFLSREHVKNPRLSLFELAAGFRAEAPRFNRLIQRELKCSTKGFSNELAYWKARLVLWTGYLRRFLCLEYVRQNFTSRLFVGKNWPEEYGARARRVLDPGKIGDCYRRSFISLDPGTAQSFTGTSLRSYEIMASGGLLACRKYPDFDPYGELDGHVYVGFADQDELLEKYREYAQLPRRVRSIRQNAREYAQKHHSWTSRLSSLISEAKQGKTPANTGLRGSQV